MPLWWLWNHSPVSPLVVRPHPEQTHSLGHTLPQPYDVLLESVRTAQISERRYGPTTLPTTLTE